MMELILEAVPIFMVGTLIGFLVNLTGVGGGVITIPLMSVLFNLEISAALGTAGLYMACTKLLSVISQAKSKNIDYRKSLIFLIGGLPGILILGGGISYLISQASLETAKTINDTLRWIVIFTIFLSILFILYSRFKKKQKLKNEGDNKNENSVGLASSGFFVGMIMGMTGIGGGVLVIPSLIKFTKINTKKIVGSSIFISVVLSFALSFVFAKGGLVDYEIAIVMLLGSFLGIPIAHFTSQKIQDSTLENIVVLIIFISMILMMF